MGLGCGGSWLVAGLEMLLAQCYWSIWAKFNEEEKLTKYM